MNKRTLTALKQSIQHWKRLASGKTKPGEETGATHCSLCQMFLHARDNDWCVGCPVREKTGESCCDGSPYVEAANAYEDFGLYSPEFKRAARKELKFLQSLLPKTKKKGKV